MDKNHYEVIVVGAGPAGLTAAIYLKRANYQVLVIEKSAPGGKINFTATIENYPGFENIKGPELAMKMYQQAQALGVIFDSGTIERIERNNDIFTVISDEDTYFTKALIIATGTSEKLIGVKGEKEFYGKGVSYCAVCDGALYRNKPVAVIGGGNSAFDEALYLSDLVEHIYLIHRNQNFKAGALLVERVKKKDNITILVDTIVTSINGNKTVNEIEIKNTINEETTNIKVDAIFPFIGVIPNTEFLKEFNILDNQAYVLVDSSMATKIKGLYACGDVVAKNLRQIVTATNDGAIAATSVTHYLKRG